MKPKQIYTNIISESEEDLYKITIIDPSIKNFAVVLMQNTVLSCKFYITERNTHDINEEKQNSNNFLQNLKKLSTDLFKTDNLLGTFTIKVKGLSMRAIHYIIILLMNKKISIHQIRIK